MEFRTSIPHMTTNTAEVWFKKIYSFTLTQYTIIYVHGGTIGLVIYLAYYIISVVSPEKNKMTLSGMKYLIRNL